MNQVNLVGRLTRDPELRRTGSGKAVASFTLAINRIGEGTDFVPCTVWDKQAENLEKYCHKGDRIGVSGRFTSNQYEDDKGNRRTQYSVTAVNIEFLESKKTESQTSESKTVGVQIAEEFSNDVEQFDIMDEDIEF